ncbi:MAG: DEAD/DEAH box helicase [Eubacterium sp.]|nr:DEAD/DEAH box helicase [Eubacterium sp.]
MEQSYTTLFSPVTLTRGKNYYAAGKVRDLVRTEDGFTASVVDGTSFFVKAVIRDHRLYDISCTCDEAAGGIYCKHMAAVLTRIERIDGTIVLAEKTASDKEPVKEKEDEKALAAFSSEQIDFLQNETRRLHQPDASPEEEGLGSNISEEYHYFDGEHFADGLNLQDHVLRDARDLITSGRYKPVTITFAYEDENEEGSLIGHTVLESPDEEYRKWTATLTFDADRIRESYCTNISCHYRYDRESYLERTLCRHQVAAILLTQKNLLTKNPGDTTNSAGLSLLESFQGGGEVEEMSEPAAGVGILQLSPVLTINDNAINAGFRIGQDKLYKIRNLEETLDNIRLKRTQTFGKNTKLLLGQDMMDSDSVKWLNFLEQTLAESSLWKEQHRQQSSNDREEIPSVLEIGGDMSLFGERLDRFFSTALELGKPVETVFGKGASRQKTELTAEEKELMLELSIHADMDPRRNIFHGIILEGNCPDIFYGQESAYYVDGTGLCRISPQIVRRIRPLLEASQDGLIRIRIGRIHLAYFYRRTLPGLRAAANITEYDETIIRQYLPPDPEFITYLDVNDEMVFAKSDVYYGDNLYSVDDVILEWEEKIRLQNERDRDAESELAEVLLRYLPSHSEEYRIFYSAKKKDRIFDLLNEGVEKLHKLSDVRMTERFRRLRIRSRLKVHAGVSLGNNLMDLRISTPDLSREELLDILNHYRTKKHYVQLKNGDYFKIDENETVEALSLLLETLDISPREFVEGKLSVPAYRAVYVNRMLEDAREVYLERDEHFRNLIREFRIAGDGDYEVPPSLADTLREYQVIGYRWLSMLDENGFGGILADDMGLGKTLQVITVMLADKLYHMERSEELPATTLIVCPASLVYNWQEELSRFAPELIVRSVAGNPDERQKWIDDYKDVDVLVTSYDLLRRDVALYEDCLFRFFIVDEAQYIKNHNTEIARSVKLIKSCTRFALTGTPIENRLSELWSIFDFLMPGFLYDYGTFREEFEIPVVRKHNEKVTELLKRMVSPFILRRMKQDVLTDLPEKLEQTRYAKMEEEQQTLYDGQVTELLSLLEGGTDADFNKNRFRILSMLTRIRQICCDPALCFEGYEGPSAKRELCLELVKSMSQAGHKMLIFSQFTSIFDLLEADLKEAEIPYYKMVGNTPKAKRLQMVHDFNEDETPVFLISLKAGGTGLNLTGADVVIHYDPWWNIAAQNQATDRSYRIGQENPVTVLKLIAKGTVEDRILSLQESKRKLAETILSAEGVGTTELDRQELLNLLEEADQMIREGN